MSANAALSAVRAKIDEIDGQLLSLLDARAGLAAEVAAAKRAEPSPTLPVRPAREAQILRDLTRRPRAAATNRLILRVWREIIGESVALQGGVRFSVFAGAEPAYAIARVRARFGAAAPVQLAETPEAALAHARAPNCAAVLPLGNTSPWWGRLLAEPNLRIFSILPEAAADGRIEAVAVGISAGEPSGDDLTFWVTDAPGRSDAVEDRLSQAGFAATLLAEAGGLKLYALHGFVQDADPRLKDGFGVLSGVIGHAPAPFAFEI